MSVSIPRVRARSGPMRAIIAVAAVGALALAGASAAEARGVSGGGKKLECVNVVLWDGSSTLSCRDAQGTLPPLT